MLAGEITPHLKTEGSFTKPIYVDIDIETTTAKTTNLALASEKETFASLDSSSDAHTPISDSECESSDGDQNAMAKILSTSNQVENIKLPSTQQLALDRSVSMSIAQSRFWFLESAVRDQRTFNVTSIVHLKGDLDVERFGRAFITVGQQHEAIRTIF